MKYAKYGMTLFDGKDKRFAQFAAMAVPPIRSLMDVSLLALQLF